jgi:hypothetical protein
MYTNPLQFEIQYECTEHLIHGARPQRRREKGPRA